MTNAEAWFNISLRPWKTEGSLGRTAQDGHLDSHTAPELCVEDVPLVEFMYLAYARLPGNSCHRHCRSLLCSCDVFQALFKSLCLLNKYTEFRSCVKVKVAILGSPF